ncbi:RNA polymerase-associated protein RapA [compost metagenome]
MKAPHLVHTNIHSNLYGPMYHHGGGISMRIINQQENIRPIHDQLQLHFDREWFSEFDNRIQGGGPWDDWTLYQLAYEAEEATLIPSFDELQCLKHLGSLEPMTHQIDTAKRVLNQMRGRAILADEVGLGKTIEAGLILKEYMLRGLVRRTLILVPASLVLQWVR